MNISLFPASILRADRSSNPALSADGQSSVARPRVKKSPNAFERDVVCVFGLPFDRTTLPKAVSAVRHAIRHRERLNVATPNMNILRLAREDANTRDALLHADLSVADGMPILWLARWIGVPLPERVAGSELFDALDRGRDDDVSTFFFGGRQTDSDALMRRFARGNSGVTVVGALAPGFGTVEALSASANLDAINDTNPDMLVVSISARKGLQWITRNEARLNAPVIANLGATILFATGAVKRAPPLWRRAGLEWLWRIREEPWLWSRYAGDLRALADLLLRHGLPVLALRLLRTVKARREAGRVEVLHRAGRSGRTIKLTGALTHAALRPLREAFSATVGEPGGIVLDLGEATQLDETALGLILVAYGQQRRAGRDFRIAGAGRRMRFFMRAHGCGFLLPTAARPASAGTAVPVAGATQRTP